MKTGKALIDRPTLARLLLKAVKMNEEWDKMMTSEDCSLEHFRMAMIELQSVILEISKKI